MDKVHIYWYGVIEGYYYRKEGGKMKQITKNIKHAMIDAEIESERKLAQIIDLKKSTMNKKMLQGGPWKPEERKRLVAALNTTEEKIFGESEVS